MLGHADKHSAAFSKDAYQRILDGKIADKDMWKYSSFWYKDFDDMAKKTMLRQLISRWGVMSTELQKAYESDIEVPSEIKDEDFITIEDESLEISPEEIPIPWDEKEEQVDLNAL